MKGALAKRSNLNRDYDAEKRNKVFLKAAAKRIYEFVNSEATGIKMLRSGLQVSCFCKGSFSQIVEADEIISIVWLQSIKDDLLKTLPMEEIEKIVPRESL